MKKSLLYLFMLVCSVTLFTGCSDDDDTEFVQVTDISGDYQGRLVVSINGSAAEPVSQLISIVKSGEQNSQVLLSLRNFSFAEQLVGDIEVPCTVVEKDGVQEFSGQKDLSFTTEFGTVLGTLPTSVNGTVEGKSINIKIGVTVTTLNQTVDVVFDGERLVEGESGNTKTYYDFETWVAGVEGQEPEMTFYEPTGWSSSNTGAHFLKAMQKADRYVITQSDDAYSGTSAVKIQSIDTKGSPALGGWIPAIPKITSGSLFLGSFVTDIANTLNSTKFGIPFSQKPVSLKGWYKYTPGEEYYIVNQEPYKDHCNEAVVDNSKTDEFAISAVLYETEDYAEDLSDCLTGVDGEDGIYTSSRVAAIAQLTGGKQESWKEFTLNFDWKKEYDANKKYRFTIICSSSKDGDKFWGAPGSTLMVDNFELTAE
ncbi:MULTISPECIES: PCMD domain-containing protein [Bacteroides]|uniref:PCMD domain-containing protein n=1 Tax=Bacteroides TaxID=816 RepID=UPI00258ED4C9|nr:PCMD domain-containing protein [Bacteroides acidifaciens]